MTLKMLIGSALRLLNCMTQTLPHLPGHFSPRNRKQNSTQYSVTLISLCSLHIYVGSLQRKGAGGEQGSPACCLQACVWKACITRWAVWERSCEQSQQTWNRRCSKPFTHLGIFSFNSYSPYEPAYVFFSVVSPPLWFLFYRWGKLKHRVAE